MTLKLSASPGMVTGLTMSPHDVGESVPKATTTSEADGLPVSASTRSRTEVSASTRSRTHQDQGAKPVYPLPNANRPGTGGGRRRPEGTKPLYVDVDAAVRNELQTAYQVAVAQSLGHRLPFGGFVEEILRRELIVLRDTYNGGEPFPEATNPLNTGRRRR